MKRKNNTDLTLITIVVERKGCESNRIEFMLWCCFTCRPVLEINFFVVVIFIYPSPIKMFGDQK